MATMIAPAALVTGPARIALPYGLDSAVLGWRTGDRFETGVEWDALTCDPAQGRGGPYCDPADVIGLPKDLASWDGLAFGQATPFVILGEFSCNPIGGGLDQAQARANEHLLAREVQRAEQAFWTGDLGNIPNLSGANGYPAPVSAGTHDTAIDALAAVELGIAREYGAVGVVHMSTRTGSLLSKYLELRGNRATTKLGTPVVIGSGYPDVPEIVGTPALFGYRSEIFTSSNRTGDLLDRNVNQMYAVAERSYLVGFDPCPVVKATYTGEVTP